MSFITSRRLVWVRIVVLTFIACRMITDPASVLEYSGVLVLASSMELPLLMYNDKSEIYGLIGIIALVMILGDFGSVLEDNVRYFETSTLLRLIFCFCLCIYCYFGSYIPICNSAVFCYGFVETWFAILTYNTLRNEKYQRITKQAKRYEELSEKYDRGELTKEETRIFENKMNEAEYQRIMSEFRH